MGRYRKIETRTWGDEKFMELSPIPACGQGLWLYLLTGPHTNSIPGLFVCGKASLAEALDWEPEDFGKAFGELLGKGMIQFDAKTRLIWVPNAIKYNLPESPNVIRSWKAQIRELPDSPLLTTALNSIKGSIYAMGEGFQKAFREAFGEGLPQPSPNQEQEQEQEQEEEYAAAEKSAADTPVENSSQEEPDPTDPTRALVVPTGLKFTRKDLLSLYLAVGPKAQEHLDRYALKKAQHGYRYANDWAGMREWWKNSGGPEKWLCGPSPPGLREELSPRQVEASRPIKAPTAEEILKAREELWREEPVEATG